MAARAAKLSSLREPLRKHGIRLTRQRELLFGLIHNSHTHLNADQLFELAKAKDPKINRVTVYRTLKVFKEQGLVDELDLMHFQGEHHYYETRLKPEHAHIVCMGCGSVVEYFGEPLKKIREQVESQFGLRDALRPAVLEDFEVVAGQIADQASLGVAHRGRHLDQVDAGTEAGHHPLLLRRRCTAGECEKQQHAGRAGKGRGSRAVEHALGSLQTLARPL